MMQEIINWLRNEAEIKMKNSIWRKDNAAAMRGSTAKELKQVKAIAEAMAGRKLPMVGVTRQSAINSARADESIGGRMEAESRKLSAWADYLEEINKS